MYYELILLHHGGVVAKKLVCGGGAGRGRQYPLGPNGPRGNKNTHQYQYVSGSLTLPPEINMTRLHKSRSSRSELEFD